MKIRYKTIIFFSLLIIIFLVDLFFLIINTSSLEKTFSLTRNKNEPQIQDLKTILQAIDFLNQRKPLEPEGESVSPEVSKQPTPGLKIKMEILNGTGIAGKAKDLGSTLSVLGNFEEISTKNTEKATETILRVKKSVDSELKNQIIKIVSQEFPEVSQEIQPDNSEFDVSIVLGIKK